MKLTGRAEEEFNKWKKSNLLEASRYGLAIVNIFDELPPSMKWGVYLDFFESKGFALRVLPSDIDQWSFDILEPDIMIPFFKISENDGFETRLEAQEECIKEVNKILNQIT